MAQVMNTVLKGASGGFGEWDWVEADAVEGCEDLNDFETYVLGEELGEWARTDELSGRIHNEMGQVYKVEDGEFDGEKNYKYVMVWVE